MKTKTLLTALGASGIGLVVLSSIFVFFATIGDAPRRDFATKAEQAAYQEGWRHADEHIKLQSRVFWVNDKLLYVGLVALSVSLLAIASRLKQSKGPNQSSDPTLASGTPAAGQPPRLP